MKTVAVAFEHATRELGKLKVVLSESDGLPARTIHQCFASGVLQNEAARARNEKGQRIRR